LTGLLVSLLLVPPVNCLFIACLGAALGRRRGGRALTIVGLAGLLLFAIPIVPDTLTGFLESGLNAPQTGPTPGASMLPASTPPASMAPSLAPPSLAPPNPAPQPTAPQAIVILSGDQSEIRVGSGASYRVGALTLEREQAGAALARRTHLPVLVTGGALHSWSPTLADLMSASMKDDFNVPVTWEERNAPDTWGNATGSAAILRKAGITSVYVVTHAWHMKRALLAFRRAGLAVTAAPVAIDGKSTLRGSEFLPSPKAWLESFYAMHELIGWAWYAIRP
jgi:uncharacterized SAM-binding protein YcdF (DUF218 family)